MTVTRANERGRGIRWRATAWSIAAGLLLMPMLAMQFTDEVRWTAGDFLFAAVLIGGTGLLLELAVWRSGDRAYRVGTALGLAAAFLLVWINGAVGIIGSEDNPLNLLYGGVLVLALLGALVGRFRAASMAWAMVAAAVAQAGVSVVALTQGHATIGIDAAFVLLWLLSARAFQSAARGR
jgi:hypothetical protein